MPVKKYLEIDSTYRNRNMYPNPGSFSVNIAQGISKTQNNALDPVSNAYTDIVFQPENFNGITFTLTIASGTNPPLPEISSSSKTTLIMTTENIFLSGSYLINTLSGLVLINNQSPNYILRRIISSKFLNTDTSTDPIIYYLQLEIDNPIPDEEVFATNTFTIYNPTTILTATANFFLPTNKPIENYYKNFILYNRTKGNYSIITSFDAITHMAEVNEINDVNWELSDIYEVKKEPPIFVGTLGSGLSGFPNSYDIGRLVGPYCINSFLQVSTEQGINIFQVFKIINIIGTYEDENENIVYTTNIDLMTSFTNYVILNSNYDLNSCFFEFLSFSYDNSVNFSYSGSMVSVTQQSAYEVKLNHICLPNIVLQNGGYIWQYPFVYVEIENVSSSSNSLNLIYSNNPNSNKAVFKVPIINTTTYDPKNFPFITYSGNDMSQTMTIKPNSDMRICVKLPNGTIFSPYVFVYQSATFFTFDTLNGQAPDPSNQLSVLFSFEKV